MATQIVQARCDDAEVVATLVGELLHEIMAALKEQAFHFHYDDTVIRVRSWLKDGLYTVLLARKGGEPIGFLALYQSYALYTEGVYGTIPEFYVRPAHRSKGVGAALLEQARRLGQARSWRRLEVTTPPLPQFDRTLAFYQREGFSISGGRKLKRELP
ncbi:GNAT family N-acetyltransferase [Nitrospira sp. NS4]|uniref:GNAT family N-acetyltransferase n=1 Tax=Nitrospira sp. NS4 TaxID=3414498 RepID=UPI003C2E5045